MTSNITPPTPHFTTPQLHTTSSLGGITTLPSTSDITSSAIPPEIGKGSPTPPETLVKICLLWTVLHQTVSLPPACKGVIPPEKVKEIRARGEYGNVLSSIHGKGGGVDEDGKERVLYTPEKKFERDVRFNYRYTSRSLSVIGVLGGIVLILLVVALSTCIKNRRNIMMEQQRTGHERFARQILIDHIRHLSSSRRFTSTNNSNVTSQAPPGDIPPNYEDVVKSPPSVENTSAAATAKGEKDADTISCDSQLPSYVEAIEAAKENHVVQIEGHGQNGGQLEGQMTQAQALPLPRDDQMPPTSISNLNFIEPDHEQLATPRTKRRLLLGKFSDSCESLEMAPDKHRIAPYRGFAAHQ